MELHAVKLPFPDQGPFLERLGPIQVLELVQGAQPKIVAGVRD